MNPPGERRAGHRLGRRVVRLTALAVFAVTLPSAPTAAADPDRAAVVAGRDFLDRYVTADGRVVRRDQGGDTVSEGQAYAMLIAVGVGDRAAFDDVWSWTVANLQRSDGLLAWRWDDGQVVDRMPATDADLAAASALALAAARFSEGAYLREARRMSEAILAHETQPMAGTLALTPGPWAGPEGPVNGSYFMVNAMSRLWWATGDARWATVAASARDLVDRLSREGVGLLPDWAVLDADGGVRAVASPDGRSPRFGYEAARALVQFAVDCRPGGQRLAARAWEFFDRQRPDDIRAEYDLSGVPLVPYGHPVALVGAAASADAAGAHDDADRLLDTATALDRRHPTYFGGAWIALARLWLDTDRLGGCRPT